MSVEIRGEITIIVNQNPSEDEPGVLIWTIGSGPISTSDVDSALSKAFPERYKEFCNEEVNNDS